MADATYPDDLLYHPEHAWARVEGELATFGITWYGQDALGELVAVEPPEPGARVAQGESYADVESVKAVSDVFAPLSGEVVEVNAALSERVRLSDPAERAAMLEAAAYAATLPAA